MSAETAARLLVDGEHDVHEPVAMAGRHRLGICLLVAAAAACSGRTPEAPSDRNAPRPAAATSETTAHDLHDAGGASQVETGSITGATSAPVPCPSGHGPSNRMCFAVAHGPFVLTDLEAFAFPWYPTQTQGLQDAIAFPGPSGVAQLPAAFAPRWQTQATEYWSSGWQMPAGESRSSGEPQINRYSRAVHGARYVVSDREDLYVAVLYRGCWKDGAFERDACSPGSAPEISATFSGYHAP